MKTIQLLGASILTAISVVDAHAEDIQRFQISGFASIVAGQVLHGSNDPSSGFANCTAPCFIADWSNAGVYDRRLTLKPESRVGVQGSYQFNEHLSTTIQATSRATDPSPRLEWAYLSYKIGDWDLQLGRKRIPLYFYSDFQDVGLAYPWITPPPDLYGWEVTNYNGASVRYRTRLNDVALSASLFKGYEHLKDARIYRIYGSERVDTQWNNLIGADLEVCKGWWTIRFAHSSTNIRDHFRSSDIYGKERSTATGMALNVDLGDWVFLFEVGENARKSRDPNYPNRKILSLMNTVAYRIGPWTPFASVSRFHEHDVSADYQASRWFSYGAGVRYDVNTLQALKVQWSQTHDTLDKFTGNTSVLRASYDVQF
jgi:hypothetical protein